MTSASVAVTTQARRGRLRLRRSWAVAAGLGLFSISAVVPLLFMAATAFRHESDWDRNKIGLPTTASFGAFERAWTGANIGVYFRNSAIVTVSTVVLTVVCATLAGYSFGKIRWRLRGPVYFFVLAWLAIPPLLGRRWMGMGDAKLALLIGVGLGWGVFGAVLIAFLCVFPVALLLLLLRGGLAARKTTIPFGPFLSLGALIVLFGPHLAGLPTS